MMRVGLYPTRFNAEVAEVEAQLHGPPPPNDRNVMQDRP